MMRARGTTSMSRSRILLIVALGAVAVLARVLWVNAPKSERVRGQDHSAETAQVTVDLPKSEARRRIEALNVEPDETPDVAVPETAHEAAAELRKRARFPPTSHRIDDNLDPIVQMRAVKERVSPAGQGRKPTLVVFASSLSYEAPSPIIIYAKFIHEYPSDWSTRSDAEIAGELRNSGDSVVGQVDLRDDGQGRDIEAGDGVFTAEIDPTDDDLRQWKGLIRVQVWGQTTDGEKRNAKTHFYYGAPSAKLTGTYTDKLADGHLQIDAGVEVSEAGQYHLEATLSGSKGLIAWAENTVQLGPGTKSIPLTFWGLALREANEPGPYRLSSIALANVSADPPQLDDAIGTSYETAAYKPDDFSGETYNDPQLLEKADRLDTTGTQ
jgi:hypothetical protein